MLIQEPENEIIRQFLISKNWKAIEGLMEKILQDYKEQSTLRQNAEETLKATYLKEGAIQGILRIKQELFLKAEK